MMNKFIFYLIVINVLCFWSLGAHGQEKGRESKIGELDFSAMAKYKVLHPDPLVRMDIDDDDDDIVHPTMSPILDSSLMMKPIPHKFIPGPSLPVSPSPTDSFESTLDNGTVIPPDTHGAVDGTYCITTINSTVKIQTRAGGAVSSVSLNTFFSPINSAGGTFDPRVHYDPYSNRWMIIAVSGANNVSDSTSVLIAVSKTNDPTGSWWMYLVRAYTAHTYWLDFPDVGFNGKWITVTGNLFQNSPGTGYAGAKVFVFDKSKLYAGTGASYTAFIQASDFTICPSLNYDASEGSMWGVESWNGGAEAVNLWKITGSVGSESMTHIAYPLSGLQWLNTSFCVTGPTPGADFAPQAGGTGNLIQTNDDRIDQVVFMNGYLWFAQTIFLPYSTTANPTRSSIQWWQIDTAGTPIQTGTIDDASGTNFYAFPSLAVNTNNDLLIGFATFSVSTYPSGAYALRMHTDAVDSVRPYYTFRHGLNTYYKTFGAGKNRWGDYSGTCLDPTNSLDFWTIQEASSSTANTWDTYWAHVQVCSTPSSITGTTSVCVSATVNLSDATSGGTWSSGTTSVATVGTSGTVSGVSAGTATITYMVSGGCLVTTTVTVNALPGTITGTKSVCVSATTALSDAGGGTWTSSTSSVATVGTSGIVSGVSAGTSTITYTLSTGCSATAVVTVNALPSGITGTLTVCPSKTTALSDAGGGSWTTSTSTVATVGSGTGLVSGVAAGTSTITYTLSSGCTTTAVVTVNPLPSTITGTAVVCVGSTTALTDAGGGTWTTSTSSVATVGSGSGIVSGVGGGTSTITYTLPTGCTATVVVTVNPLPSAISGTLSVCAGSGTSLSDAGGGTWTSSTSSVATVVLGTGSVSGVSSGTSTITYTLGTGCSITAVVTVNPLPSSISGTAVVCVGSSTALSDAGGGSWTSSTSSVATVGSGSGAVFGVSGGTSTITYTLGTGCNITTVVTVNPLPSAISGTKTVCVGSNTTLSDAGGGTWTSSTSSVATVGSGSGIVAALLAGTSTITYTLGTGCNITTVVTVNPLPSSITGTLTACASGGTTTLSDAGGGTWSSSTSSVATVGSGSGIVTAGIAGTSTITYTLGTGCTTTSVVTVNPLPGAITGTATVCAGLTTALTDAGGGSWSSGNTAVATVGSGSGVVSGVAGGTSTITYTISTGCTSSKVVTVNPLPGAIIGATGVCVGSTTTLSDAGGGTWISSNTVVATIGSGSGLVNGLSSGTSTVTYTLPTGCLMTTTLTVNALPSSVTGTTGVCVGLSTTLSDAGGGTWSSSNTSVATVGSGSGTVSGVLAGTATITYTLGIGCATSTTVTVNPLPSGITGTASVCVGLTTALTDAGGGTWSSSNTTLATVGTSGIVTGVASGNPLITYTLPTGCITFVTTTVNPLPASISGSGSLCVGSNTTLSDAGGGSWSSSSTSVATVGSSSGTVAGLLSGTSTITYTLGTGCLITTVETVNPLPSGISGTPAVCAGLTTSLSDAGGGTWTSSTSSVATVVSGSGLVTGVAFGTSTITYTLGTGCTTLKVVTVNPLPAAISGVNSVCIGSSTSLSDAGGGTWSSSNTSVATVGSGSGVVNGLISGTSTVTYTLPTGCIITTTVTVNPLPTAITGITSVCAGLSTTLSDAGGGTWTSGNTTVASVGLGSGVVNGLVAGTATITYTAGAGCTVNTTVTVNPVPSLISGLSAVCAGSSITLSDGGGGTWSSGATSVAAVGSSSGVVNGVLAGTATITYTLATGCIAMSTITVNPLPSVITGASSVCTGASATLSDAGSGTWASGTTAVATVGSGSGVVTGVTPGSSTITYTLGTGCLTTSAITVYLTPSAITGTNVVCAGLTTALTDAGGGTWSSGTTTVATVGIGSGVVTGVAGGTSTITYALTGGCTAVNTVTVNPLPAGILGSTSVCSGLSTTLSDASTPGVWTSSNTAVATVGSGSGVVTGSSVGTTTITYKLVTGCLMTTTITVNVVPAAITGNTNICLGSSSALTDGTGGGTWSSSNTSVATAGSAGVIAGVATGTSTITYTLGAGCTTVTTVTVNPLPGSISGTTNVCPGLTTALSDAGGGTWSSGNTAIATVSGSGLVSGLLSGTTTITYTLPTGCTTIAALTVNPLPSAITGTANVCQGLTTALSDAGGGTWTSSTSGVATVGLSSGVVSGVVAGTSTITYTLGTGCYNTTVVTVNPLPASITGTHSVCAGSNTALSDAGGGTWTSGNTSVATIGVGTGLVAGVTAGTSTITYSLSTGCIALAVVTVNPLPGVITGSANVCEGFTTSLSDGGGGTWTSSTSSVATVGLGTGIVSGILAGTTTITYTLSTGCSTTALITVNTLPGLISGTTEICAGSSTTLSDGGSGTWSSGNTAVAIIGVGSGIVNGLLSGTSTITYSLGTGCTTTTVITVDPLPLAITGIAGVCQGQTTLLSDATGSGAWASSNTAVATISGGGLLSGLSAGTTTVSYTLGTGCFVTITATVNPLPAAISGASNVCVGSTVALSDAGGGAWTSSNTGMATVSVSSGIVSGVSPGTPLISYTLAGCSTTMTMSVNPLPNVYTVSGGGSFCAGGTGVHVKLSNSDAGVNYKLFDGITLISTTPGTTAALDFGPMTAAGTYTVVAVNAGTGCTSNMAGSALVTITPLATPSVTVTASPGDTICESGYVTFTAVAAFGGSSPFFQWSKNSINVATGPTYSPVPIPANGDIIGCTLTSDYVCLLTAIAVSTPLTLHVEANSINLDTIKVTRSSIKAGEIDTFVVVAPHAGASPSYQWYVNSTQVAGATNATYITSKLKDGDKVECRVTSSDICSAPLTNVSNTIVMTVSSGVNPMVNTGAGLTLVPNPNKGEFTISGTLKNSGDRLVGIVVTDMLGQTVYRKTVNASGGYLNEHIVFDPSIANGTYLVKIISGDEPVVFHVEVSK